MDWFLPASVLVCGALWFLIGVVAGMVHWSGVDRLSPAHVLGERFWLYWGAAGVCLAGIGVGDVRAERRRMRLLWRRQAGEPAGSIWKDEP